MRLEIPTLEQIESVDFGKLGDSVNVGIRRNEFLHPKGNNYYKLLALFSAQLPENSLVFDIGSGHGLSALALSYNPKINIVSYDVSRAERQIEVKTPPNVEFLLGNVLDDKRLLDGIFIFLDINHLGPEEQNIIDFLIKQNWRGVMVMDDIMDYPGLKKVWDDIKLEKYDITNIGHFSGMGIIYF